MADTVDPKYLDKRTAERYLRSGQLDEKALERHLKGLPDVADKATTVETFMLDDIMDDDDDFEDDEDEADDEDESSDDADEVAAADDADDADDDADKADAADDAPRNTEGGEEPGTP